MKTFKLSLFIFLLSTVNNVLSQADCSTALKIYSGVTYTIPLDTGIVNIDSSIDYNCVSVPNNPKWFFLQLCTSGNTSIVIQGTGSGGSGVDIDFVLWGPLSSPSHCDSTYAPVEDCSFSTAFVEYADITGGNAGEYYQLVITNYGNTPGTINFTDAGGLASYGDCDSICSTFLQPICFVTTDHSINKNVIIWNKDTSFPILNYEIQKESTTTGVFNTIEIIPSTDTSAQIDSVTNPMIHANQYRICVTDTCGVLQCGEPHQNIHLQTSISMLGYPQLIWNPYIGFSYGTYYIYRGNTPTTLVPYDSLASSSAAYTDYSPIAGMNYYSVGVKPPTPCTPSRSSASISYSNVSTVNYIGIFESESLIPVSLYPNPTNGNLNFEFANPGLYTIAITDISGNIIFKNQLYCNHFRTLDLSKFENGNYFISITNDLTSVTKRLTIMK